MNRILIAHEKHGNRYFDISTPELFAEKTFTLLKERFNQGYYSPYTPKDLHKPFPHLPDEFIEKLFNDSNKLYEQSKKAYENVRKAYEEELALYEEIEHIIDNGEIVKYQTVASGRYPISYKYLDMRSDAEYERVTIENVE